ncbi:MAG: response regulator [Myxococcota bacterium]
MAKRTTVLIVDDSSYASKQLGQVIESIAGFAVIGYATNGAEAVQLYQELTPDVVCMDIVMPILDGLQALRAIKKIDGEAKVVIVTSVGTRGEKRDEALRLGAKSVISKPFEASSVRSVLESL